MASINIAIISEYSDAEKVRSSLAAYGFNCAVFANDNNIIEKIMELEAQLALIDLRISHPRSIQLELPRRVKQLQKIPVIALVSKDLLDTIDLSPVLDDFVIEPWDLVELAIRIKRVYRRASNLEGETLIRCGGLEIDLENCEVSVEGRLVTLTYKEYELLKLLASNKGKVFTREALLDEIWGYDYFGGDRTVDVHVRRLRSKIEDHTHSFIETVRNIGYKFKKNI